MTLDDIFGGKFDLVAAPAGTLFSRVNGYWMLSLPTENGRGRYVERAPNDWRRVQRTDDGGLVVG